MLTFSDLDKMESWIRNLFQSENELLGHYSIINLNLTRTYDAEVEVLIYFI